MTITRRMLRSNTQMGKKSRPQQQKSFKIASKDSFSTARRSRDRRIQGIRRAQSILSWNEFFESVSLFPHFQGFKDLQALLDSISSHPQSFFKKELGRSVKRQNSSHSRISPRLVKSMLALRFFRNTYLPRFQRSYSLHTTTLTHRAMRTILIENITAVEERGFGAHRHRKHFMAHVRLRMGSYYVSTKCQSRQVPAGGEHSGGKNVNKETSDGK